MYMSFDLGETVDNAENLGVSPSSFEELLGVPILATNAVENITDVSPLVSIWGEDTSHTAILRLSEGGSDGFMVVEDVLPMWHCMGDGSDDVQEYLQSTVATYPKITDQIYAQNWLPYMDCMGELSEVTNSLKSLGYSNAVLYIGFYIVENAHKLRIPSTLAGSRVLSITRYNALKLLLDRVSE